jgi:hypothetical protein
MINKSRIHPFVPTTSCLPNGMAFENLETGEILDFPESWRTNLDGVEHIIMCNLAGDYEEQAPLFPNWW